MKEIVENVRKKGVRIHNITNYVTVNDCANITLACGAFPIMADDPSEVEEIVSVCDGLNLNLGTPNDRKIEAMILAGKKANELGIPVVFDPVGVGVSSYRVQACSRLLAQVHVSLIRGNISEIKALAGMDSDAHGLEAGVLDKVNEANLDFVIAFAKAFAKKMGAVLVLSGQIDIVCDSNQAYVIRNGHSYMSKVSGTGCMLSSLCAAYIASDPFDVLSAGAAAVCAMGLAGELAYSRMSHLDGNVSYRNYLIDAINTMKPEQLEKGAKYEVR